MKRPVIIGGGLVVAALLQVAIAPHIAIGGVVPNFMFLLVVTIALIEGRTTGCTIGFVAGVLFDLLGSGPVGAMALVLTVVGYVAGTLSEQLFAEGWLQPLTVLAIAALASEVLYGLSLAVLGVGGPFWPALTSVMIPGALYNTVLALFLYPWLARFLRQDRPMTTFRRLA